MFLRGFIKTAGYVTDLLKNTGANTRSLRREVALGIKKSRSAAKAGKPTKPVSFFTGNQATDVASLKVGPRGQPRLDH